MRAKVTSPKMLARPRSWPYSTLPRSWPSASTTSSRRCSNSACVIPAAWSPDSQSTNLSNRVNEAVKTPSTVSDAYACTRLLLCQRSGVGTHEPNGKEPLSITTRPPRRRSTPSTAHLQTSRTQRNKVATPDTPGKELGAHVPTTSATGRGWAVPRGTGSRDPHSHPARPEVTLMPPTARLLSVEVVNAITKAATGSVECRGRRAERSSLAGGAMQPLRHSYTNDTRGDGRVVVKRYEGPDAPVRRSRERAMLARLQGLLPVPALLGGAESGETQDGVRRRGARPGTDRGGHGRGRAAGVRSNATSHPSP